jgi:hypothetical protein
MIKKYEIDIIQLRQCLGDVCEELFSDMTVAYRIYERIDDAVEDFLYDNILDEGADDEVN